MKKVKNIPNIKDLQNKIKNLKAKLSEAKTCAINYANKLCFINGFITCNNSRIKQWQKYKKARR